MRDIEQKAKEYLSKVGYGLGCELSNPPKYNQLPDLLIGFAKFLQTEVSDSWVSVADIEKIREHASALRMIGEFGEFSIVDDDKMIDDITQNSKAILRLLPNPPKE